MKSTVSGGRSNDDAAYPVQYADFGTIGGVAVTLTAFSPIDLPGVNLMCYPYAFFEVAVTNTTGDSAEAGVALLAGTATNPVLVQGKGIASSPGTFQQAVFAQSDDPLAVVSAGSDSGFFKSGLCNNKIVSADSRVAVKVSLAAGESKHCRFVYAWYNQVNGSEGNYGMFQYLNTFTGASAVADTGLAHFDQLRNNATNLVTRMRASNFPAWIKNQALVSLSNLTNNSMYRQDGRYAHTEGEWYTNGTNDQMWMSRQIYAMMIPSLQWQELHYWARTQKTSPVGQIHHDLGNGGPSNIGFMTLWDDQQHPDYRVIDNWVDLNCAFIISVYETFIATADTAQLSWIWPYVQLAGQRILNQVSQYGSSAYPFTFQGTLNTYDANGANTDPYNAGLSLPTYKILSILSGIKGNDSLQHLYDSASVMDSGSFTNRYLSGNFPSGEYCEGSMAGQWLAYCLKLGDLFDTARINYALGQLNSYYSPLTKGLGFPSGSYNEWTPLLVTHYGGLALQTGGVASWRALQHDWYNRVFGDRDIIFNQKLDIPPQVTTPKYIADADSFSGVMEYISIPAVWRNYYTMVGYFRNKYTGELRLEPIIPPEMNFTMSNALIFSPEGYATVSCTGSPADSFIQSIIFKPDSPLAVSAIYLKDKGAGTVYVMLNDSPVTPQRIGSGYSRELKINWTGTVPSSGITLTVSDNPIAVLSRHQAVHAAEPTINCTAGMVTITTCNSVPHEIRLYTLSGRLVAAYNGFGVRKYRFGAGDRPGGMSLQPGAYVVNITSGSAVMHARIALSR